MVAFSKQEQDYLSGQILGRLATVDGRGGPHIVPTGFRLDPDGGVISIGGHNLTATKKFRDARENPQVAFVVDDLPSTDPWRARGVEIRGEAEVFTEDGEHLGPGFGGAWIRITPTRVTSWVLDGGSR